MNRNMRRFLLLSSSILAILLVVAFFAINYAIEYTLPYSPIRPRRITAEDIQKSFGEPLTPSAIGLAWKQFDITVEDTILLRGWFVESPTKPAAGTVFLLHGIGSSKEFMIPTAAFLARAGFNTVLYDSRANGESGGLNCTFGYYEKKDLSTYIDSTETRFPDSSPYGVFGSSLGAAVAVQAMALDKRIVCGIIESPFADLRTVIHDYFARMFLIRADWIPDRALTHTENIAHFAIDSVQPAIAARFVSQPTMVIHGLNDDRINPAYGKLVFDNLRSREKEWYPISGGGHDNLHKAGGKEYEQRIVAFFQKQLKKGD